MVPNKPKSKRHAQAAEILDERERNLWPELTALAWTLIDVRRHPGAQVSSDPEFNPPGVTVATLRRSHA
jgi:hypothetical protein